MALPTPRPGDPIPSSFLDGAVRDEAKKLGFDFFVHETAAYPMIPAEASTPEIPSGRTVRVVAFSAKCHRCGEAFAAEMQRVGIALLDAAGEPGPVLVGLRAFVAKLRDHRSGHDAVDGSITRDQLIRELDRAFRATRPEHEAAALVRAFEKITNPAKLAEASYLLQYAPEDLFASRPRSSTRDWLDRRDAWQSENGTYGTPPAHALRPAGLNSGASLRAFNEIEPGPFSGSLSIDVLDMDETEVRLARGFLEIYRSMGLSDQQAARAASRAIIDRRGY